MTKEAYYKRNWTPGPPPKQIIDHTHQPYEFTLQMWHESYQSTRQRGDQFYYVDANGKEFPIAKHWYDIVFQMMSWWARPPTSACFPTVPSLC